MCGFKLDFCSSWWTTSTTRREVIELSYGMLRLSSRKCEKYHKDAAISQSYSIAAAAAATSFTHLDVAAQVGRRTRSLSLTLTTKQTHSKWRWVGTKLDAESFPFNSKELSTLWNWNWVINSTKENAHYSFNSIQFEPNWEISEKWIRGSVAKNEKKQN